MPYRRFVFSAISSSHASSASKSSERGLRNSAESKGLRMKTMPSEGTRESWTYGDADADGPCAGLIVGKADVKYEGLSRSVNGVDPVTTLTVISSFNSASRRSVAISGETDTSLVSKIADVEIAIMLYGVDILRRKPGP